MEKLAILETKFYTVSPPTHPLWVVFPHFRAFVPILFLHGMENLPQMVLFPFPFYQIQISIRAWLKSTRRSIT
ncbi:hypothetical protein EHQ49_02765 [Leptospira perdikensis]|uniref:Uncharacterized protein n=1 Tax=Leptospira perdikensis TaxID=2484948 RepID=A0A4R9JHQ4_9LEPT|nr:hypothetical protein EHQ49_02765 [Leptospira perdikensis]